MSAVPSFEPLTSVRHWAAVTSPYITPVVKPIRLAARRTSSPAPSLAISSGRDESGQHARTLAGHVGDDHAGMYLNVLLGEHLLDEEAGFRFLAWGQPVHGLHNADPSAQPGEQLRQLKTHITAAKHDQRIG